MHKKKKHKRKFIINYDSLKWPTAILYSMFTEMPLASFEYEYFVSSNYEKKAGPSNQKKKEKKMENPFD